MGSQVPHKLVGFNFETLKITSFSLSIICTPLSPSLQSSYHLHHHYHHHHHQCQAWGWIYFLLHWLLPFPRIRKFSLTFIAYEIYKSHHHLNLMRIVTHHYTQIFHYPLHSLMLTLLSSMRSISLVIPGVTHIWDADLLQATYFLWVSVLVLGRCWLLCKGAIEQQIAWHIRMVARFASTRCGILVTRFTAPSPKNLVFPQVPQKLLGWEVGLLRTHNLKTIH